MPRPSRLPDNFRSGDFFNIDNVLLGEFYRPLYRPGLRLFHAYHLLRGIGYRLSL